MAARRRRSSDAAPSPEPGRPRAVRRGPLCARTGDSSATVWLSALPLGDGPSADEPLGHALAALDAHWVFLAAEAVAGHEERLRQFARVLRPSPRGRRPVGTVDRPASLPFGVAVRKNGDATQTFLEIANDSPYPIRLACLLDAPAERARSRTSAAGSAWRRRPRPAVVTWSSTCSPSASRRSGSGRRACRSSSVTPYPSEAVLTSMQARSRELAANWRG